MTKLTQEEILELSGRQLSLYVHTEVMEYTIWEQTRGEYTYVVFQHPDEQQRRSQNYSEIQGYREISIAEVDFNKKIVTALPDYASDISATWEVAEKLNRKCGFSLGRAGDYEPDRKWNVRIGKNEWVEADTAPEAICKAALLANLEEKGEEKE